MTLICEHGHVFNAKKFIEKCPARTEQVKDGKFVPCSGRVEKYSPSKHLNKNGTFRKSSFK